jgi:hypothetical protein
MHFPCSRLQKSLAFTGICFLRKSKKMFLFLKNFESSLWVFYSFFRSRNASILSRGYSCLKINTFLFNFLFFCGFSKNQLNFSSKADQSHFLVEAFKKTK